MKDMKFELMMIGVSILFLFCLFDFTHCLIAYGVITYKNSLSYQVLIMLIPILLVICVIVKILKWNTGFDEIIGSAFTLFLFWVFTMAFALPCSLFFAGICQGIMLLDLFI